MEAGLKSWNLVPSKQEDLVDVTINGTEYLVDHDTGAIVHAILLATQALRSISWFASKIDEKLKEDLQS